MTMWMHINDIKTDVLYGLLIGRAFINKVTLENGKDWSLWFYTTSKGRRRGMLYHKRQNQGGDYLTFEIKMIDLFKQSRLETVIPKEKHIDEDAMRFLIRGRNK